MTTPCRIGVTRWEDVPGEAVDRYWGRVVEAGGEVIDLDESKKDCLAEIMPGLDAVMLTGGIDVDPSKYGAERHPKVKETAPGRDEMEIAFTLAALERDIPVLAICRGHQLLNVAFGGTLLQHIESGDHRADFRTEGYPSRWHTVRVLPDSRVGRAFDANELFINSRHHQAVRKSDLASGLRAVGFADDHGDTLVEAMESMQHQWVVGVQWHPERPEEHKPGFHPLQKRLFDAFIAQARRGRAG